MEVPIEVSEPLGLDGLPQFTTLAEQEQRILSEIQELQSRLRSCKILAEEKAAEEEKAGRVQSAEAVMGKNRLIVVSNRLPVTQVGFVKRCTVRAVSLSFVAPGYR